MDDVCNSLDFLRVIYFIKILIDVIMIVVPIGLIIMGLIDLSKSVVTGDEGERKKGLNIFIKRVISAIMLFAVPWIVKLFVHILTTSGFESDYLSCYENANSEKIKELDEIRKTEEANAKALKEKERAERAQNKNSTSGSSSNSTGGGSSSGNAKDYTIFVGDSRTEGMCGAVDIGSNAECIAETGKGYKWLKDEKLGEIKSKLGTHPNSNVVINLGVNDYDSIDSYISLYNELSSSYPSAKFVIVSVTHVDDNRSPYVKNKDIESFNNKLKNGLNSSITYCDIYSYVKNNYDTSDGIHYSGDTYNGIYSAIKKCL